MSIENINAVRADITKQAREIDSPLANFIEEHINRACLTDEIADRVKDKKISDLMKMIEDKARSKAKNGCAMIPHEEVEEMIDEFFELQDLNIKNSNAAEKVNVLDLI